MIAEMAKVQIAIPSSKKDELLQFLQEEEVIHVASTETSQQAPQSDTAYTLAQLQFGLEFLGKVRNRLHLNPKRDFKNMFAPRPAASLAELERVTSALDVSKLLKEVHHLSDEITTLDAEALQVEERVAELAPWRDLALRGGLQPSYAPIIHTLLKITTHDEEGISELIQAIPSSIWQRVNRYSENKGQQVIYGELIIHEKHQAQLDELLRRPGVEHITLDLDENETVAERLTLLEEKQAEVFKHIESALLGAKKLLTKEQDIQFAYDAYLHLQEREEQEKDMHISSFAAIITGWLPKRWVKRMRERVESAFPSAAVEEVSFTEDEVPPVALINKPLVRPFEAVTNIYGKPAYHELDPTGALSLFFLISFGLALTDAGYGIVMMVTMFVAERFFRLKREMRKMVRLLFYAGAATTVLGALTGGWFGITLEELPAGTIRDLLLSWKVIDPISNPIGLLLVSFAIGIVQLLAAWGVRGYHNWTTGNKLSVFLDDVPWITMVTFILLWAGANQGVFLVNAVGILKWAAIANAIFLVLTQGREAKNPFIRLGSGVISLYGLVSFLSDMLSYSRLLALGLATGIIGLVVNLIAGMVSSSIPFVGFLLAIVVLIVGHVFNLGINALGAFIHSGRLQFVEFFPKFMEGGGQPYKPFGRVSKYVDNPKEFA